jgi:hypothetical protein
MLANAVVKVPGGEFTGQKAVVDAMCKGDPVVRKLLLFIQVPCGLILRGQNAITAV